MSPLRKNPAVEFNHPPFLADLNGDGILDVSLAFDNQVSLMLGTGNGAFQTQARVAPYTSVLSDPDVLTGDFNNGGKPDLAIFD